MTNNKDNDESNSIHSEAREDSMDRARLQRFEKPQSLDIDGWVPPSPPIKSFLPNHVEVNPDYKDHVMLCHPIQLSRLAPQIKITPMSDLESDTDSAGGPCPHQSGMNFLR